MIFLILRNAVYNIQQYCVTCPTHPVIFKEDEMGQLCRMNKEMRSAYKNFVRKHEGKRLLGRHRKRQDNIKMNQTNRV
jgi:hypothetical protein